MQQLWRRLAVTVVAGGLLSGCVSAYVRPPLDLPDRFAHAPVTQSSPQTDDRWWRAIGDPALDLLVERVLQGNRNLATAALTVRRARLTANLTKLDQWPTLSGGINGVRTSNASTYAANLTVSYYADLWRRLAATSSAAQWQARATEQDRQATRIALIATTCALYWDILFTRQQIATGEADLVAQRRLLELVTARRTFGALSTVEVAEADLAVETSVAAQSVLAQHLVEDQAALMILAGDGPAPGMPVAQGLDGVLSPDVPAGLPVSLVSRRPDVRAAELRLRASLAGVDAAHAAVYPDLALTAAGGAASSALRSLLSHPVGSLTAALTLPFLDYPRHRLTSRIAETDYEVAVLTFQTAVMQALSEVDNALSNRRELVAQRLTLIQSLASASTVERLVSVRYREGAVALDILLDAQQRRRAARRALDANALARLTNFSTLSQALGRGADIGGQN